MIATVTNLQSVAVAVGDLPFPFNMLALDEAGGSVPAKAVGVNGADLYQGEEKGSPAWKAINLLIQEGKITVAFAAASGNLVDVSESLARV